MELILFIAKGEFRVQTLKLVKSRSSSYSTVILIKSCTKDRFMEIPLNPDDQYHFSMQFNVPQFLVLVQCRH